VTAQPRVVDNPLTHASHRITHLERTFPHHQHPQHNFKPHKPINYHRPTYSLTIEIYSKINPAKPWLSYLQYYALFTMISIKRHAAYSLIALTSVIFYNLLKMFMETSPDNGFFFFLIWESLSTNYLRAQYPSPKGKYFGPGIYYAMVGGATIIARSLATLLEIPASLKLNMKCLSMRLLSGLPSFVRSY